MSVPLAIFDLGPTEMLIVGIVAVLLFGERLPEVGRTFGKKFVEFRKGLQTIEGELHSISRDITSSSPTSSTSLSSPSKPATAGRNDLKDYAEATAPKFEPPAAAPPSAEVGAESAGG